MKLRKASTVLSLIIYQKEKGLVSEDSFYMETK